MRRIAIAIATLGLAFTGLAAVPAQATTCGLTNDADGTVSPVVCPNGKPNARAKKFVRKSTPTILMLKKSATSAEIITAVCTDIKNSRASYPMVQDGLDYVAAGNRWPSSTVSSVMNQLINGTICKS